MSEHSTSRVKHTRDGKLDSAAAASRRRSRKRLRQQAPGEDVLALQRVAGNRAVDHTLQALLDAGTLSQPGEPGELQAEQLAARALTALQPAEVEEENGAPGPQEPLEREIETALGPGERLSPAEQRHFETHLGQDLSAVRLHHGPQAAGLANALDARAFTVGDQIVFNAGEHDPGSNVGQGLLGHELAHAAQNQAGFAGAPQAGPAVQRKPKDEPVEKPLGKLRLLDPERKDEPPFGISLRPRGVPPPQVSRLGGGIVATVYFAQDSFLMDSENFRVVNKLAEELGLMLEPAVFVDGHASSEGEAAKNQTLSERRRQAVIAVLSAGGRGGTFKPRFLGAAYGATKPTESETGKGDELEEQRSRNRRVEISILPQVAGKPSGSVAPEPPKKLDLTFKPKEETREEELERIFKKPPVSFEHPKISLKGALDKKFEEFMENLLSKTGVPKDYRGFIKDGARKLVEKGFEEALDKALEESKADKTTREAIKKSIEAGIRVEFEF